MVVVLTASIVGAAAIVAALRRGGAETSADGGRRAPSASDGSAGSAVRASVERAASTRAVARADFTDRDDAADPTAGAPPGPVAPHLRRVAIALSYDDGYPIAFAAVLAVLPRGPEGDFVDPPLDEDGPWNVAAGVVPTGTTDARGVVTLVLPRSERCALASVPRFDPPEDARAYPGPRFRTADFAADADAIALTIPARATRLRLVDLDGAPLAGRRVEAFGPGAAGDGESVALTADAEGVVVFRGFAEGPPLLCDVSEDLRVRADGPPAAETAASAAPPAELLEDELRVPVGAAVEVRFRRLSVVRARLVDPRGAPAENATMTVVATYAGVGAAPVVSASSGADGVVYLAVPADGERMSAAAAPTELRCEFDAPGRATTTSLPLPPPSAPRYFDYGDVPLPFFETFRLTVRYADGVPCEDADVSAHYGDVAASRERARSVARTNADGLAILPDERLPGRRGFLVRRGALGLVVPDDPAARAPEGPGLIVRLPSTADLTYALPESTAPDFLRATIEWDAVGDVYAGAAHAGFDPRGVVRFAFVPAGTTVRAAFSDCAGWYATKATTIPAEGGFVSDVAPPPPVVALRTRVVDAEGREVVSYDVEAFGADGSVVYRRASDEPPPLPRPDGTVDEPCLRARSGDEIVVVASVEGRPIASSRVRVAAPTTPVELAVAPTKTIRLRFVDPSPLGLAHQRLAVRVASPFGERTPSQTSVTGDAVEFAAPVPAGRAARASAEYCGETYERDVPPDVDAVEFVARPTGVLDARTAARPLAATFVVDVVGAGDRRIEANSSEWRTPREASWTLPPFRLPAGRYRVRASLLLEGTGAPVELGERQVDVVPNVRTLVEF